MADVEWARETGFKPLEAAGSPLSEHKGGFKAARRSESRQPTDI